MQREADTTGVELRPCIGPRIVARLHAEHLAVERTHAGKVLHVHHRAAQSHKGKRYVMAGRECYHCKQWIEEGEAHDCWTTTEAALTRDLSEDLRDAWERLRETAAAFGDQRIYASHNSIMFSRKSCYFFVRPKKSFLEVCVFLGRVVKAPRGTARRSHIEVQGRAHHPDHAPRRSRGTDHRLASGGVRLLAAAPTRCPVAKNGRRAADTSRADVEAPLTLLQQSTGLMSTTGVPSIASMGPIRSRFPSISFTTTGWRPRGFGRSGDRVVNTPASGLLGLDRGCTWKTSRRPWCSHVMTMSSSWTAIPSRPSVAQGIHFEPRVRRALRSLFGRFTRVARY